MSNLTNLVTELNTCKNNLVTNLQGLGVTASAGDSFNTLVTKTALIPSDSIIGNRIKDDNDVDIGMVSSIFTDANNQKYAVVCLNAEYRGTSLNLVPGSGTVSALPSYNNSAVWAAKETATFNTDTIIAAFSASQACNLCRGYSFVINGTTYYGQVPNIIELLEIFINRITINSTDPTASNYPTRIIPDSIATWASTRANSSNMWIVNSYGLVQSVGGSLSYFVAPVLEIPID